MTHAEKTRDMAALAAYGAELRRDPRLIYLFFELTDACNLSCIHCGSSASPRNRRYLETETICKVLDSVARRYTPRDIMVCLSGGEPLLHPDFFKIVAEAKKRGFACGITTNGTLVDHWTAVRMKRAGIDSVSFSLDGLRESHDWFRNRRGSFEQTVRGIRELVKTAGERIRIQITTVIHNRNLDQLEAMYDLALELGVHSWRAVNLEPIGRARTHDDLLLDRAGYLRLLHFIRQKRAEARSPMEVTYGCSHYLTPEYEREVREHYFFCGSGIYVGSVLCNGDIYSCIDIERRPELVQGNAAHDDFVEVWENRFQAFRADRSAHCTKCAACPDRRFCGGDSAHTWDYDRQEPLLCLKDWLGSEEEDAI